MMTTAQAIGDKRGCWLVKASKNRQLEACLDFGSTYEAEVLLAAMDGQP